MIKNKIVEKYGHAGIHHSCVYLDNGEQILRNILEQLKPLRTVIEIGTYQGVSAAVISEYAEKVHTFDIVFMPLRMKILRHLGIKNISCHVVKNNTEKELEINKIFETEKVDLCFIDGEHSKGQPPIDFEICRQCDQILMHDYSEAFDEVYKFCNDLEGYEKKISGTFCLLTKKSESAPKVNIKKKRGRYGKSCKKRV